MPRSRDSSAASYHGARRLRVAGRNHQRRAAFPLAGLHAGCEPSFYEPPAVGAVERTLDGMAAAKLNVFHWHLSDDQSFRAESKKFPRLTEVASEGEFYTQDQLREVVAYARARGIRVVPERIHMPGHGSSWIMAYPELGAGGAHHYVAGGLRNDHRGP